MLTPVYARSQYYERGGYKHVFLSQKSLREKTVEERSRRWNSPALYVTEHCTEKRWLG